VLDVIPIFWYQKHFVMKLKRYFSVTESAILFFYKTDLKQNIRRKKTHIRVNVVLLILLCLNIIFSCCNTCFYNHQHFLTIKFCLSCIIIELKLNHLTNLIHPVIRKFIVIVVVLAMNRFE